jgi:hypothetical protein
VNFRTYFSLMLSPSLTIRLLTLSTVPLVGIQWWYAYANGHIAHT